jgi:hypothetical protein
MRILCLVTAVTVAYAVNAQAWLCESGDVDSLRDGLTIKACGTARASSETTARAQAFDAAQAEATRVCQAQTDCKGHELSADPKRTECEPAGHGQVTCKRLVTFTIGHAPITVAQPQQAPRASSESIKCPPAWTEYEAMDKVMWASARDEISWSETQRQLAEVTKHGDYCNHKHASLDNTSPQK